MTTLNQLLVSATSAGLTNAVYADGDVLGNEMQWDIGTGSYAFVVAAQLIDTADVVGAVDLFLFDRSVALGTDNAPPSLSDADSLFSIGVLEFPYPKDLGGTRIAHLDSIATPIKANASGLIFGRMVTRSANAAIPTATAIQINLHFTLDV